MAPLPAYVIGSTARDAMTREQITEAEVRGVLQTWWDHQNGNPARMVHIWRAPVHALVVVVEYHSPGVPFDVINTWR